MLTKQHIKKLFPSVKLGDINAIGARRYEITKGRLKGTEIYYSSWSDVMNRPAIQITFPRGLDIWLTNTPPNRRRQATIKVGCTYQTPGLLLLNYKAKVKLGRIRPNSNWVKFGVAMTKRLDKIGAADWIREAIKGY